MQSALSGRQLLNKDTKAQNEADLLATLDSAEITIDEAVAGIDLLIQWGSDKSSYVQKANKKWPQSSAFSLN